MVLTALNPGKQRYYLTGGCEGANSSLEGLEKISCSCLDFTEYHFVYLVCLCTLMYLCSYRNRLKLYLSYA